MLHQLKTLAATALIACGGCRGDNALNTLPDGSPSTDAGVTGAAATDGPESLGASVEKDRYVTDLTFIAAERTPGSTHWQEVQDLCAKRFTELGYEVERHAYATGVNVIGIRRGMGMPAETVLVSAHYDHVASCVGGDDNGTGVAGVLEAARILAMRSHARTLAVACWDGEEERSDEDVTACGSGAYAVRASGRGDVIVGNFVVEMIGYKSREPNTQRIPSGMETAFATQVQQIQANGSRGDFLVAVLDSKSHGQGEHLVTYARAFGLPLVLFEIPADKIAAPAFAQLRRSDHASFWVNGYPGTMLTDTAEFRNKRYHCRGGPDTVDALDHDFATKVLRVTTAAAARTLAGP